MHNFSNLHIAQLRAKIQRSPAHFHDSVPTLLCEARNKHREEDDVDGRIVSYANVMVLLVKLSGTLWLLMMVGGQLFPLAGKRVEIHVHETYTGTHAPPVRLYNQRTETSRYQQTDGVAFYTLSQM